MLIVPERPMSGHPDPAQILALVRALSPELRDGVLEHLVRCPACARIAGRAVGEVRAAERGRKVLAFGRAAAPRIVPRPAEEAPPPPRVWWSRPRADAAELAEGEELLEDLLAQPEGQRPLVVHNCERFQTLPLVELVLEEGRARCFEDAHAGARLIELGISIVDLLDRDYHGRRLLDDLRARGWAFRANAHRIVGELAAAEEAFRRAAALLEGSTCRIERAAMFQLHASLLKAQNRGEEAIALLHHAAAAFEAEGEETKAGRAYATLGTVLIEMGELELAEEALAEALVRIDATEDSRTLWAVRQSMVSALAYQERYQEAAELMAELEPEWGRPRDAATRNRRRWIEGKVLVGLGRAEEGEELLDAVRREYLDGGLPLYAAYVSLELALLYERQGRSAELRRLAEEMTPVFFAQEIPRETAVALAFFARAVEQERASKVLIERVAGFLRHAQTRPAVRFADYQ